MKFNKAKINGAYVIDMETVNDQRGYFAKVWSESVFKESELELCTVEINMSFTKKKGTFRGLHYQTGLYQEAKLLRCLRGSIFDVMIDVRKKSPTYKQWFTMEISSNSHKMLYVPEGCAHGFLTLRNNTLVEYQVSSAYKPEYEKGIRYNDPAFEIEFPIEIEHLSDKDKSWPDFTNQGKHIVQ